VTSKNITAASFKRTKANENRSSKRTSTSKLQPDSTDFYKEREEKRSKAIKHSAYEQKYAKKTSCPGIPPLIETAVAFNINIFVINRRKRNTVIQHNLTKTTAFNQLTLDQRRSNMNTALTDRQYQTRTKSKPKERKTSVLQMTLWVQRPPK